MNSPGPSPSLRTVLRGRRGSLLLAFLATEFAASVDGLSYGAVLPVAADDLGGRALYAPALTAAGIVSIAFMAGGAFLYGRVGPRAQLWVATVVWLIGAALTVTAPAMGFIVAGMAIRGVASGLMAGLGIGVISGLYSDSQERERALGLIAVMWVLPSLVSPAVNALVLSWIGWRATMVWPAVLFLIGRALLSRNLRTVASTPSTTPARVRGAGSFVAVAIGIAGVQGALASRSPVWLLVGAAGIVCILALAYRRAVRETVPGMPRMTAAGWAFLLVCASYFGITTFVPLLSAHFVDLSGVIGAVLVALCPLAWGAVSGWGVGARLTGRTCALIATITFPVAAGLLSIWVLVGPRPSLTSAIVPAVVAVLSGIAMGIVYPKVMTLAFDGFREEGGTTRAHGGVVLSLSENVGTAIGATMLTGLGAKLLNADAAATAGLAAAFALVLGGAWLMIARSALWRPADQPAR